MMKFFQKKHRLLWILLLTDIILISLYVLFPDKYIFNLDMEGNIPTIYQGLKLISIAVLSFSILDFRLKKGEEFKKEWYWGFWGIMMFFLGVDEIGQIHERISELMKRVLGLLAVNYESTVSNLGYSSTPWLLYYLLLFVVATIFVIFFLKKINKDVPKAMIFLILGWLFFLFAPFMEYINTMQNIMFENGYEVLVLLEETFEIVGATFLLVFTFKAWPTSPITVGNSRKPFDIGRN